MKILTACLLVLACCHAFASSRLDFQAGWRFSTDPEKTGEQQSWFQKMPSQTEPITVPHTWNKGKNANFKGTGWYFKTFDGSPAWKGMHVELHFGATFYKSRVWLNGQLIGEHEGGYTEYHFDITSHLRASNFLAVEINNEPKADTIPGADLRQTDGTIYDWWPYGGIVRDVWLSLNEDVVIRWQHIDSHRQGSFADVAEHILLDNESILNQAVKVRVAVYAEHGNDPVTSAEKEVELGRGGDQRVDLPLRIADVKLWEIDNPFLYRSEVTVLGRDGRVLDNRSDNFGVRTIEIRDRHLYLNGERVRFSGLTRHEDSPWEGLAETRGTMLHDYEDLKNLQTTFTRPVHYPQHPWIYDFADRNGILMIPEIPMWQFSEAQMTNPRVIALAKQELRETIEQNYNHPSIFAWSMDNESSTNTPGGIAYFKSMYAYSKELDPGRLVSCADDVIATADPAANASSLADFVMWNEYFGSWDGPESLLPGIIDKIAKGYPDKMVLVTEFGYPGVFAADPATADKERVRIIREQLPLLANQDWIAGVLLWCYQDYHSERNLRAGQMDSYVDHGVVDKNRQRRPSYYVWREENSPAHLRMEWSYDDKGVPVGFRATIERRSEQEIPSYPLVNYSLQWRVLDGAKKEVASGVKMLERMGPPQSVRGSWSVAGSNSYRLELTLLRPTGFAAEEKVMIWRNPEEGAVTGEEADINQQSQP